MDTGCCAKVSIIFVCWSSPDSQPHQRSFTVCGAIDTTLRDYGQVCDMRSIPVFAGVEHQLRYNEIVFDKDEKNQLSPRTIARTKKSQFLKHPFVKCCREAVIHQCALLHQVNTLEHPRDSAHDVVLTGKIDRESTSIGIRNAPTFPKEHLRHLNLS